MAGAFDYLRFLMGWWHGQTGTISAPRRACLAVADFPITNLITADAAVTNLLVNDRATIELTVADVGCN